jgi:hypothetical protein
MGHRGQHRISARLIQRRQQARIERLDPSFRPSELPPQDVLTPKGWRSGCAEPEFRALRVGGNCARLSLWLMQLLAYLSIQLTIVNSRSLFAPDRSEIVTSPESVEIQAEISIFLNAFHCRNATPVYQPDSHVQLFAIFKRCVDLIEANPDWRKEARVQRAESARPQVRGQSPFWQASPSRARRPIARDKLVIWGLPGGVA